MIIILPIIFFIIIIIISVTIAMSIDSSYKNKNAEPEQSKYELNYSMYYEPKRYITTKNEQEFYTILLEIAKEIDVLVLAQVSLYNIIKTKENLNYKTKTIYFNKISSKSIDFVLVRKKDNKILLCIELDDSTHNNIKRQQRDFFINKLFKDLEIKLLRYPVYKKYYKETLKRKIEEKIKN